VTICHEARKRQRPNTAHKPGDTIVQRIALIRQANKQALR
jgi:hypothetical protein